MDAVIFRHASVSSTYPCPSGITVDDEHDIDVARTADHLKAFSGDESEVKGKGAKKSPAGHR